VSGYMSNEAVNQVREMLGAGDGAPASDATQDPALTETDAVQAEETRAASLPDTTEPGAEVVKDEASTTEVAEGRGALCTHEAAERRNGSGSWACRV
jgi:hypothetical protein